MFPNIQLEMSENRSNINFYLNYFFRSSRNLSGWFDGHQLLTTTKDKFLRQLTMTFHVLEFIKLTFLGLTYPSKMRYYVGEIIVSLSNVRIGFTVCEIIVNLCYLYMNVRYEQEASYPIRFKWMRYSQTQKSIWKKCFFNYRHYRTNFQRFIRIIFHFQRILNHIFETFLIIMILLPVPRTIVYFGFKPILLVPGCFLAQKIYNYRKESAATFSNYFFYITNAHFLELRLKDLFHFLKRSTRLSSQSVDKNIIRFARNFNKTIVDFQHSMVFFSDVLSHFYLVLVFLIVFLISMLIFEQMYSAVYISLGVFMISFLLILDLWFWFFNTLFTNSVSA